jgi:hypothetical protein
VASIFSNVMPELRAGSDGLHPIKNTSKIQLASVLIIFMKIVNE